MRLQPHAGSVENPRVVKDSRKNAGIANYSRRFGYFLCFFCFSAVKELHGESRTYDFGSGFRCVWKFG